ncbi:hypothetical protein KL909_000118 [Ogataea angusta]|nr:hypothetical protein KL909_000118 [Ogataea angusta]KAG7836360.1 hypothetical protein KL943_002009 [Ogataea angusta]
MAEFDKLTEAPVEFLKEGSQFVAKCTKPSKKEYLRLIRAVGLGFLMMGVVGYAIKLIHIPIRYLIVYGELKKTPTTAKKSSRSVLTTPAPDPAVQRLKEARRREKEKQEEQKRQRRLDALKKRDSERDRQNKQKPVPKNDTAKKPAAASRPPLPKMSFKELMSRAETVDKSKLVYAPIKMETKKKDTGKKPERKFAQPSTALLEKLSKREKPNVAKRDKRPVQRKAHTDSYGIEADSGDEDEDSFIEDDSLDDFVVDDPRERRRDYNSDEIWQLFNRGKKRQYFDDEDDDMEATGADILEEEERALRQARLDDKREEMLERRLKEEKLKRRRV